MKHLALLIVLLCAGLPARAACDISMELPPPWRHADAVPWRGCGTDGQGVQQALDLTAAQGGGELRLRGAGALVVEQPLRIGDRTSLHGSPEAGPHGTVLAGRLSERLGYRRRPLLVVAGVSDAAVHAFDFRAVGAQADNNLHGPAVLVHEASRILLAGLRSASVQMGIAVKNSEHVTIRGLTRGQPPGSRRQGSRRADLRSVAPAVGIIGQPHRAQSC